MLLIYHGKQSIDGEMEESHAAFETAFLTSMIQRTLVGGTRSTIMMAEAK